MGMADRTSRKQCKQCAQGGLLGIAECIFGLLCAAGWSAWCANHPTH